MTQDQINKLRDAQNLIAQIIVYDAIDLEPRDQAYDLINQVIADSNNPFTAHWRPDES